MRKWLWMVFLTVLLSGCGGAETYETISDVWLEGEIPAPRQVLVDLPGETALPAMEHDSGRAYVCNDYEIYIQTMAGGDLDATVEAMSGFRPEKLTVLSTTQGDTQRYEFVWATAGEGGDYLGRGVVLDDGNYHYTLTVLRNAASVETSSVVWDGVFSSFRLA